MFKKRQFGVNCVFSENALLPTGFHFSVSNSGWQHWSAQYDVIRTSFHTSVCKRTTLWATKLTSCKRTIRALRVTSLSLTLSHCQSAENAQFDVDFFVPCETPPIPRSQATVIFLMALESTLSLPTFSTAPLVSISWTPHPLIRHKIQGNCLVNRITRHEKPNRSPRNNIEIIHNCVVRRSLQVRKFSETSLTLHTHAITCVSFFVHTTYSYPRAPWIQVFVILYRYCYIIIIIISIIIMIQEKRIDHLSHFLSRS